MHLGPEGPVGAHVSFLDDQESFAAIIAPPSTCAQSVRPYWHGDVSICSGASDEGRTIGTWKGSMRWSISSLASGVS